MKGGQTVQASTIKETTTKLSKPQNGSSDSLASNYGFTIDLNVNIK